MTFNRDQLPDPTAYFEAQDLKLTGPGKWKTTACRFHDGSDSMRVNTSTGAWVCMACQTKGGDVLSYEMQATGTEFVDACKALGCWVDDGKPHQVQKPAPLPPRAALAALAFETTIIYMAAGNIAQGVILTDGDRARVMTAAGRITRISEAYQ